MSSREAKSIQENPPHLLSNIVNNHQNNVKNEDHDHQQQSSSRSKPALGGGGNHSSSHDRLKRDEWSEGAVSSLLQAYEEKWVLRNRAKLKGQDWEEVAKYVSSRVGSSKSSKTQTQCKNKIESMKKRYRSESATGGDSSSWPLYPRLDLLLRGSSVPPPPPQPPPPVPPPTPTANLPHQIPLVESSSLPLQQQSPQPPPRPPPPPTIQNLQSVENNEQNSHGSNGVDRVAKGEGMDMKLSDEISDKNAMETDSSTPAMYSSDKRKLKRPLITASGEKKINKNCRQRNIMMNENNTEIVDSIRSLAEVVLRMEQARMEMMKELERMRAEAEIKRGEMDLKRTEIIANTQLEIAKLFAGVVKDVDNSSFKIRRI